jgi:hypothetical protein
LFTVSTEGDIKIWDICFLLKDTESIKESQALDDKVKPIYEINTKERVLCLEVAVLN